eukprot:CAMPEP_0194048310 /NCGR_PEP_ID=MMETSP0009_2-20130614/26846_1 /TAXON_ID=210454 /ORGANISM="Grammatophora oceanica, Strain CCMP 410" /LENGTH=203 /DNA_ID=CAMNT_0038694143 /DNA_START=171 /DNA_END=782 /DNA_ORIENTATION=-
MTVRDRNTVHLTVASHPENPDVSSTEEEQVCSIQSKDEVLSKVKSLAETHNICGLVVDWPLAKDGRMGASCGLTMHTLDTLAKEQVVCKQRPFCLWDGHHTITPTKDDAFGRSSTYASTDEAEFLSDEVVISNQRRTSSSAVPKDDDMSSDSIWLDYCKTHWPHAKEAAEEEWDSNNSFTYQDSSFLDDSWEQSEGNMQVATL